MKTLPRLEISLSKIFDNTKALVDFYGQKQILVMGVTKCVLGNAPIARTLCEAGVSHIADSRLMNIIDMKSSGVEAQFVLLRTAKSQAKLVVQNIDISLNTEIDTLSELSFFAKDQNKVHQVILMIELGDLREGIMPNKIHDFIQKVNSLSHIEIVGIGSNMACNSGIAPTKIHMELLTEIAIAIETVYKIPLTIITGGNSSNYGWFRSSHNHGRINNLRLGESIFLGVDPHLQKPIIGLHTDAFRLIGEVIEAKAKPENILQDELKNHKEISRIKASKRVIIGIGHQDVDVIGLKLRENFCLLGSSSDHVIISNIDQDLKTGNTFEFGLTYNALLRAMTSPYVEKVFI